jgi:hypothetical protein
MTTQTILKQLDYTIPVSSMALSLLPTNQTYAWHLPLMKLNVDFEQGTLFMEGDWSYLVLSNRNNDAKNHYKGRGRVQIESYIYSSQPINLKDVGSDGLMLPIEGVIKDGLSTGSCSGMLIIDNDRTRHGMISNNWSIHVYLYDPQFNDTEIKCKLSLLADNTHHYEQVN